MVQLQHKNLSSLTHRKVYFSFTKYGSRWLSSADVLHVLAQYIPGISDSVSSPSHHDASWFTPVGGKNMDNCVPDHNYIGSEVTISFPDTVY